MTAGPWREVEIVLTAGHDVGDPYTGVEVWADFTHDDGVTLRRPAFYDGGRTWRVRFASPLDRGRWRWRTTSAVAGLDDVTGTLDVAPTPTTNPFHRHGFWRMSPGRRSLQHADGTPAVLVADTAWALPWRATEEEVRVYAQDRRDKGFNAVLLMSVQPDMRAVGPRDRSADEGFDVGFEDLPAGHINDLNPAYFQYLDRLIDILVEHGIVPVLQPVFQGFGWKGLDVAGTVVPPQEYARYCRYLVARYGARPAIYLVGADGSGEEPQIGAGGREVHAWDCYAQPTGIHYRPHAHAHAHQDADWLDFQWCQTGHGGEHVPERVADMWRNTPVKAVANGEPTYEQTRHADVASGWWQGHEAWSNLCAGSTMGVVYGAANIWQWVHRDGEPGHAPYFLGPAGSWRDALSHEGSTYVGLVGRILQGLPTTDMEPDWETFLNPHGLRVPGRLQILYQPHGGALRMMHDHDTPRHYRVIDPRTGKSTASGQLSAGEVIDEDVSREPRLVIFQHPAGS
ncbi:apiosidase-like domain-containing protein [Micromonospora sp. BQ11]|uniref:apiosidase-like domain-containing protein n=1 Tax=Micromonospora sp. BQ11 TaxID=3452212 RepID=UPI003F8AC85C